MRKLLATIENMFIFLAIAPVFIMVCLTTVDIAARYLFNSPIPGCYEVTEKYLMVLTVFFGLSFTYREGAHIRLTFLTDRLRSTKLKLAINYVTQIVSILYSIFLLTASTKLFVVGINEIFYATDFKLPMWPAYMVTVLGLFFACLWMIADLWQVKKGKSCLFKEEESSKEAAPV